MLKPTKLKAISQIHSQKMHNKKIIIQKKKRTTKKIKKTAYGVRIGI